MGKQPTPMNGREVGWRKVRGNNDDPPPNVVVARILLEQRLTDGNSVFDHDAITVVAELIPITFGASARPNTALTASTSRLLSHSQLKRSRAAQSAAALALPKAARSRDQLLRMR